MLRLIAVLCLTAAPAVAQPIIVSPDGEYLGEYSNDPYAPDSISNPYGRYGDPNRVDTVTNPYGRYDSNRADSGSTVLDDW